MACRTIPHLTRSSLHRCLKRHAISRLPEIAGDKAAKKPFKRYPIGYFHLDIAEVRTEEGKLYLFVAIDRTSKFVFFNCTRPPTSSQRVVLSIFGSALEAWCRSKNGHRPEAAALITCFDRAVSRIKRGRPIGSLAATVRAEAHF
jgi:hypothetical protein